MKLKIEKSTMMGYLYMDNYFKRLFSCGMENETYVTRSLNNIDYCKKNDKSVVVRGIELTLARIYQYNLKKEDVGNSYSLTLVESVETTDQDVIDFPNGKIILFYNNKDIIAINIDKNLV